MVRAVVKFRPTLETLELRLAPSGVPTQWSARGAGGGGALFSPSVSPFSANDIYVASDMSELFHTTNGGAAWTTVDFRQIQGNHDSQVQFTEDPNVRFAIDYSSVGGADHQRPAKSTDGGVTWVPLANDPTGDGEFRMAADPANHNRVLLTDYTHLFYSGDGGATWALKFTGDPNAGLHLAGAFFDGTNIYLGTNSGLLVSTNGGSSFAVSGATGLAAGQSILGFAGAKQNGTTRFFAITKAAVDVYAGIQGWDYGGSPETVYTMDYGVTNWTVAMTGIAAGTEPFYVGMARNNVAVAYVSGGSTSGTPTVYKTTDGGAHWANVLQTTNNQNVQTGWQGAGGDHQWTYGEAALGFTVAGNDANHVVITDFGFAHSTTDGGASWQALYVQPADLNPAGANTPHGKNYHSSGLDNTTAWQVNWTGASTMLVSNSDIFGTRSTNAGASFSFDYSGPTTNSLYRTVIGSNGTVYAATSSVHDLYQSTRLTDSIIDPGTGSVLFSTDAGHTWQSMHNFNDPVVWVATDPTNANRLYAAVVNSTAGDVYVTNNANLGAASTWARLATPPRAQGHPFNVVVLNDGSIVASYSGRRAGSPLAFTASSGVFLSTNGGATWADRSDPGMKYWTNDVVVDPSDPTQSTWYAGVFSGWGGPANGLGGLYKTTDRGQHWARINAEDRVTSVTFNPNDPNELFMTTETDGLWYSNNIHSAGPTFSQVASYPFRQPERVFFNPYNPNEIWVTSFGGGLMVGTTSTVATATALAFAQQPTNVAAGSAMAPAVTVRVVDANGNTVTTANTAVTLALGTNPGGSTLGGTVTANAVNGVATFSTLTLNKSGAGYTLTATGGGLTGAASAAFTVTGGAATHVGLSAPAAATAGSPFAVTLTALDAFNNPATYVGTVHFASTDPQAALPANYTFTAADAGAHTFAGGVTLKTAGGDTVTVSDTGNAALTASAVVAVAAAAASRFQMSAPSAATAGAAFSVTVSALDPYGNTAVGYRGTAHFTSTDPQAALPANYAFTTADAGIHSFANAVTLKTAGNDTVTAMDTVTGSITANAAVTVTAAAASAYRVTGPTAAAAGSPFSVTVTALDPFGNSAGGYRGTAHFASTDPQSVLPANYAFTAADNGTHTFANAVTLRTVGSQAVTAADTTTGSITGQLSGITVTSGSTVASLAFAQPLLAGVSGSAFAPAPVVRLLDAAGNLVTTATGTVTVTIGANPGGALSFAATSTTAVPVVNGVATFANLVPVGSGVGFTLVGQFGALAVTSAPFRSVNQSHIMPVVAAPDIFGPHPNASANEAFVKGLYRELLGRDAAPSEATFYANQLANGQLTQAQAVANFFNSTENRTREIVGYYNNFLGRTPAQSEINFYVGLMQSGVDESSVVSGFFHSAEENAVANDVYVTRLYRGLVSRDPTAAELSFYVNLLNTGTSRDAVYQSFIHAPDTANVAVVSYYVAYLQRVPASTEVSLHATALANGSVSYGTVAKTFLGSAEFFADAAAALP